MKIEIYKITCAHTVILTIMLAIAALLNGMKYELYIIPLSSVFSSLVLALFFMPSFSSGWKNSLLMLIYSAMCQALILSVFVYASGIRAGMFNDATRTAGYTIFTFSYIYAAGLAGFYFIAQLTPKEEG